MTPTPHREISPEHLQAQIDDLKRQITKLEKLKPRKPRKPLRCRLGFHQSLRWRDAVDGVPIENQPWRCGRCDPGGHPDNKLPQLPPHPSATVADSNENVIPSTNIEYLRLSRIHEEQLKLTDPVTVALMEADRAAIRVIVASYANDEAVAQVDETIERLMQVGRDYQDSVRKHLYGDTDIPAGETPVRS